MLLTLREQNRNRLQQKNQKSNFSKFFLHIWKQIKTKKEKQKENEK